MHIKGKFAVVIGGARGIGHAYCRMLLQKGAMVYMGDILEKEGEAAVEELQAEFGAESIYFCKVDVTKTSDVKEIFRRAKETLGRIDVAVGNAAIINEIDWESCVDINLNGTIRVTREALEHMGKDKGGDGGVIVHTASVQGLQPVASQPVYGTTKHAVIAYCRNWAMEPHYKNHGVRINCVCPTGVETDMWNQIERAYFLEEKQAELKSLDPLTPIEVAEGLIQLIEDDSYNGTALRVTKAFGRDVAVFHDAPLNLQ